MNARSGIYAGHVVHKRLSPCAHGFKYKVFALALDLDEVESLSDCLRLFSYNRFGVTSFFDADHGRGDGRTAAAHIRSTLADAGFAEAGARVVLVCYPRILGFVFNPLSVYFCYEAEGRLAVIVYEVTNTFAERTSYVIPVGGNGAIVRQACAKRMYVSPFTEPQASYGFHVVPPEDSVVIGVNLRDAGGPVLKTHFRGERLPLTNRNLAAVLARHPLMTLKVVAAIHVEAARLWMKRVPLARRHVSPGYSVSVVRPVEELAHA